MNRATPTNDVDWPAIPYADYLRQQLDGITQYEYINPKLDRRYDPVVVSGGAMHPVIQRGDVILIDTGLKEPEDGRPVAVNVGGGRTVIGYWRVRKGGPVLEQESTYKVVDLAEYPGWEVYGVVTKIIGRGIPPHPPVESRTEEGHMKDVTPGQAQYVVERLIKERRISRSDVKRYLADLGKEIGAIEERIRTLREAAGPAAVSTSPAKRPRKTAKKASKKKGHPRGIAGTFAVLLRGIPEAARTQYEELRASKGLKAAIAALRKATK